MNLTHEQELAEIKRLLLGVGLFRDKGCWIWFGSRDTGGYGRLGVGGRAELAHRLSYEVFKGPVTPDLFVCHACDTPACINPDHLFLGTAADNSLDRVLKERARRRAELEAIGIEAETVT